MVIMGFSFKRWFKAFSFTLISLLQRNIQTLRASRLLSSIKQPDKWLYLPGRRDLYPSRVFQPAKRSASSSPTPTPLPALILVAGGAFMMNTPAVDDAAAIVLADLCNALVINVDYRKAPYHTFPAAYQDIVSTITHLLSPAVAADLGIDTTKVILVGSSAGANLSLAAVQDERLQGKLKGVVGQYPLVNMFPTFREMWETRPDPSVPDFLGNSTDMGLAELYLGRELPDREVLKDKRLSPSYFDKREHLPSHVFLIGCEHDMLCYEAKKMALNLAAAEGFEVVDGPGDWEVGNVKWKLIKGQTHAFDQFVKKDEREEAKRAHDTRHLRESVASWARGVFAT